MDTFPEQTDAPRRLSRRHFLRIVAGVGAAGAVGQLLAACGTAAPSTPAAPAATSGPITVDQNKPTAGPAANRRRDRNSRRHVHLLAQQRLR